MEKGKGKYLAGGIIATLGAIIYNQYDKIKSSDIAFKRVKIIKVGTNGDIELDLFLDVTNNSDINFTIRDQFYTIYVSGVKLLDMENKNPQLIKRRNISEVKINIKFTHMKNSDIMNILFSGKGIYIKVLIFLRVKIPLLPIISIPYTYETTLMELLESYK